MPTIEEVKPRIADYIAGFNASGDHSIEDLTDAGLPSRPTRRCTDGCPSRRVYNPEALALLLMHWERPLKVGKHGISLKVYGVRMRYGMFDSALCELKGTDRKVQVAYNPEDLSTIRVFDAKTLAPITIASSNELGGRHGDASREAMERFRKAEGAHKRRLKGLGIEGCPLRYTDLLSPAEQFAQSDAYNTPQAPADAPLKLVGTGLDAAAEEPAVPIA